MNNLKEKLELMQWLAYQGFKPNWFRVICGNQLQNGIRLINRVEFSVAVDIGNLTNLDVEPWFPLEQVLELLPSTVGHNGVGNSYTLTMDKFVTSSYLLQYVAPSLAGVKSGLKQLEDDPHLSALKLLKQVIEKHPEVIK